MTVTLSTHVLDAVQGTPAAGMTVVLTAPDGPTPQTLTDADGRARWTGLVAGPHRLTFQTGTWSAALDRPVFYPSVDLHVELVDGHTHVALLLSTYSYTTYKGS
ncbi:hypothetical protein EB75_21920 [Mycobacterium sp. ST-F2]|uniref:hydroxyisourate hydrolase n=1 Tax=Mycobacterium sp. ST-F2 TaxID=1490484 RepID=UPI00093A1B9A|nr:hydroxyisourate hydrolase [Mycobacterium sp. ST-F2]OKH79948.1 hypothetical protein EB75_21920 [Mycobacterium sp. ST-F2]